MSEIWTIKRLREWTTQFLAKKGVEKAGLDADLLLAHALGCKRIELITRCDEEAPEAARTRFRELVVPCFVRFPLVARAATERPVPCFRCHS